MGTAVSRGHAAGSAWIHRQAEQSGDGKKIPTARVLHEVTRWRKAATAAGKELKVLARQRGRHAGAAIFGAQKLILEDPAFGSEVERQISESRLDAVSAVRVAAERLADPLVAASDGHLSEIRLDIADVAGRVARLIEPASSTEITPGAVVVVRELSPSSLMEIVKTDPVAIVAENGGWTSHAFILARELGIPAVTGIKGITRLVRKGERVSVDGFSGEVVIRPSSTASSGGGASTAKDRAGRPEKPLRRGYVSTADGASIRIRANVDSREAYSAAVDNGGGGVGLFRSELLFAKLGRFPSEKIQESTYRALAVDAGAHGAIIRTFDLGAEQLAQLGALPEKNPALGSRGVRLMFGYERQFRGQLRALLKASHGKHLGILLPMVSDLSEVQRVKSMLREEAARIRRAGGRVGRPRIGVMIEVPSAFLMVRELLTEVDFVNLGTNDLVQYLLAADRDNDVVASSFRSLHPAVLRALRQVIEAGRLADKPVVVCGEMAAAPEYVAVLLGLGARDLSISAKALLRVVPFIEGVSLKDCSDLAERMLNCSSVEDSETVLATGFRQLHPN